MEVGENMLKLSIIIPVYNVEQYIGNCLDSCLNQDLPKDEYEIVVVDDGSPDNSSSIVEGYMKKYSNIRLIHRENGGLSAARNTGLREAKGEYIWFVDSDDWIESNCLGFLVNTAKDNDLDVLCFGLQLVYPDGRKTTYNIKYEESDKVYKGEDFICRVKMPPAAWAAIYKKDFLNIKKLCFFEGILHEDQEFTPRAYYLANRISYINRVIYYYLQRVGGIMISSRNKKRASDLLTVADSLYKFIIDNVDTSNKAYEEMMEKVNFAFSQSLAYYKSSYFSISAYKNKPYYPLFLSHDLDLKMRLKYILLNVSLRLYLLIYKLF